MSAHKIVVVESEKSPKVCSSNWKEDVILKKKLQILDRSQRTVINRIVVDQKIVNRRFQTKLNRSKMSYARATGNVELQKRLRDQTTFVLNTNIGHSDDDDETLKRIWDRGRRTYKRRLESDVFRKKKEIGAFTCIEDDTKTKSTAKKNSNIPDRPLTGIYLGSDTPVVIDKSYANRRPATSVDQRPRYSSSDGRGNAPFAVIQRSLSMELKTKHDSEEKKENIPSERTTKPYQCESGIPAAEMSSLKASTPLDMADATANSKTEPEKNENEAAMRSDSKDGKHDKTVLDQSEPHLALSSGKSKPEGEQKSSVLKESGSIQQEKKILNQSKIDNSETGRENIRPKESSSAEGNDLAPIAIVQLVNSVEKTPNGKIPESDSSVPVLRMESLNDVKSSLPAKVVKEIKSEATESRLATQNELNPRTSEGESRSTTTRTKVRGRPATAGGFLRTVNNMLATPRTSTARAASAKPAGARRNPTQAGIGSMFQDDEFQISLLDFQRFVVYSANYEARVKRYAEQIKSLRVDKTRAMDYYTLKLQSQSDKCRKMLKMEAARDPTEEDIKRETGNLNIKSLTLKTVNTDLPLEPKSYRSSPLL